MRPASPQHRLEAADGVLRLRGGVGAAESELFLDEADEQIRSEKREKWKSNVQHGATAESGEGERGGRERGRAAAKGKMVAEFSQR